jgi:hypothetical protein
VPISGGDGRVSLVVSVALGPGPADEVMAATILEAFGGTSSRHEAG